MKLGSNTALWATGVGTLVSSFVTLRYKSFALRAREWAEEFIDPVDIAEAESMSHNFNMTANGALALGITFVVLFAASSRAKMIETQKIKQLNRDQDVLDSHFDL